ncbi:response regulator transcription factor [Athalassotoga saccharophila]|uniref:response regulator transcription factor n=1 Tax=Athalassotoga saccharophila TaxID=1441386 RepID=UPI001379AC7A|nr:response regulator transcription factor [Athalassotoga saccharophila]BBJ28622.1 response regulator ArlR [Athalassotoga saccharophila]
MKVLIVEDNLELCKNLEEIFSENGFIVDTAHDGEKAIDLLFSSEYDLVILDIMLPKMSGWDVCLNARKAKLRVPILMLTAKDAVSDKIKGLDMGADDYLVKPFDIGELLARSRTLIRRNAWTKSNTIEIKNVRIDTLGKIVRVDDKEVKLSKKEYDILLYLAINRGKIVEREEIIDHVWETGFEMYSNVVDVYINYIREKFKKQGVDDLIETIRGIGYRIRG